MGDRGLGRVDEAPGTCEVRRGMGQSPGGARAFSGSESRKETGVSREVEGKPGDLMAQN